MKEFDADRFRQKEYKRKQGANGGFNAERARGDDIESVLTLAIETAEGNKIHGYSNDDAGLSEFKRQSIDFLEFLREQNNNGGSLTPTVESWCTYLGISRVTLMNYEHKRSESWREYISYMKNVLMACKTELASKGKIPPIVYVFDATNNGSQYYNTSEFKLTKTPDAEVIERATVESPESIAQRYRARLADMQADSEN